MLPRAARDGLLRPRHLLERHLEPEIASRHHDGVARLQNLLEVLERFRPLQLGDERDVRAAGFRHQLARLPEVGRGLHEADRDHVDAERQPEPQVVDVLRRDRRRRQRHARRVDALVLADFAAFDHGRLNLPAVGRIDAQFDEAVGQQQSIARA